MFRVGRHEPEHLVGAEAAEIDVGEMAASFRPGLGEARFEEVCVPAQDLENSPLGARLVGGTDLSGGPGFRKSTLVRIWGITVKRKSMCLQSGRRDCRASPPRSSFKRTA